MTTQMLPNLSLLITNLFNKKNKIDNIRRITTNFNNFDHSNKLKTYKSVFKKHNYTEDDPTLMYDGKITDKSDALSSHYAKISGHIPDPPNPNMQHINDTIHSLDPFVNNSMTFVPHPPPPDPDDQRVLQPPSLEPIPLNSGDIVEEFDEINDGFDMSFYDALSDWDDIDNFSEREVSDDDAKMMDLPVNESFSLASNNRNTGNRSRNHNNCAMSDDKHFSVQSAISLANPKGAPGVDQLKTIHLKQNIHDISSLLCILYNTWNATYHIPYYTRIGAIQSLLKRPGGDTPSDYRPITLLPIFFKIYERLVLNEMNKHHNFRNALHKLQGGNRARRG
eukprot:316376_1